MASEPNSFWSRMSRKRLHSNSDPPDPPPDPNTQPNSTDNEAIRTLKSALKILQGGLEVFPPLGSAVDELVECTRYLQIADCNGQEYGQLAADLASLAHSLQAHLSQSKPTYMPFSVENVARAIREQAQHIQLQQDRSRTRRPDKARNYDEGILSCYRRVMVLFQQLQVDISLSVWDVVQEGQMEARLQRLSPVDDAWYDSSLAETMTKRRACTPKTREGVLTGAHEWTRDDQGAKIYWMNGMAGTGKTTIAYSLCQRLDDDKQLGASFFCSRDSPDCRSVRRIVPTIAYQLARYSNPYRQAVCSVLSNNPDVAKKNIDTQLKNLLVKPLGGVKEAMPSDVVVVIDALDECADISGTNQVLDLLFEYAKDMPIKFFVTSRPEPGICAKIIPRDDSSRSILRLHDIEQSLVQDDIKIYLTEELARTLEPTEIDRLSIRAGSLFIFAATAVRYILPETGSVNSRRRLATLLGLDPNPDPNNKSYQDIDKLYAAILCSALDKQVLEDREVETRQLVLWTVVCAREPLTMATITELLGLTDDQDVKLAVQPLQSVLHISESTRIVSTLHASFPDFLLSETRADSSSYCDEAKHNGRLATWCFELMKRSLRFNICQLETSYHFDDDVPNLQSRVDRAISTGLFYACRYWGDHSQSSATPSTTHLDEFLRHRLLFWMEVLNLKGSIGLGEGILSQVLSWLPTNEASTELRQFTYDARNFVTTFAGNPTSLSTPHIYLSVLPFTINQSHVRTNYWPRTRGLLRVGGTGMKARSRAPLATWTVGRGVMSIAQSGDGKRIVSWAKDDTLSIWDASKGNRIVGPLPGSQSQSLNWGLFVYSRSVAFSVDGTRIASGSEDRTIRLWDSHSGNLITAPLEGHTKPVLAVAFSSDGIRLISGSLDHSIRMWDARNGSPLGNIFQGHQHAVQSVVFSPDGKRIASGSSDNTIRIWDVQTVTTIVGPIEGHTHWVYSVAFSPDGLRIVSGSLDKTICVWDAYSGDILAGPFKGRTENVTSVAFSPDGRRVVSGSSDCTIRIWDPQNGALLTTPLEGHRDSVNSVLFSTDGTRILSGSDDGTICVWDARHGTTAASKSSGHTSSINSVAFSPDGNRAVSGSRDWTIRVWDTRDGRLVLGPLEGHTGNVLSVAFSPDGAQIVSGSFDRTIRTWDANSGALIGDSFEGHTNWVRSVAYSPDGRRIASGSADQTIRVWDSQTGKPVTAPFIGHTYWVESVAWSPDGTCIVSGSRDKTVRMWNAQEGAALWASDAHTDYVYCVAYSPDGTRVVSGSEDCTILVLNADDGTVLHGPFKGRTEIWSVAFSPDGTRIVSGSWDDTVCVWDAQNGTLVSGPFQGHTGPVRSVAFSPDGRRVVSCSHDSTIRFWDVATADRPPPAYFDHFLLRDDGWVTNSDSQLVVWLPPDLRAGFPRCSLTISSRGAIHVDYNDLLVGERWNESYRDSTIMTVP